jgi:hypothetical protein
MAKRETIKTPVVTLVYPKITRPDTYGEYADGKFKTSFTIDDPAKAKAFKEKLTAMAKAALPSVKKPKMPWKTDEDSGEITFRSTGSQYRPAVFDGKNNPIPESVGISGGTKARLMISLNPFKDRMSFYVAQVQVKELVEYQRGESKSAFAEDDDAYEFDGASDTVTEDTASDTTEDADDNDPF